MTYSRDMLRAIARDILNDRTPAYNAFSKVANVNEERENFLRQYKLDPQIFVDDPVVGRPIQERQKALESQIRDFYKMQGASTGMTDEMRLSQQRMLDQLGHQSRQSIAAGSIDRTRQVAMQNPDDFKRTLELSRTSDKALDNAYGREVGMATGGLAGLAGGYAVGSLLPRRTKGITQKAVGSALGWAGGMAAGRALGERLDEKKTGFNHEDILKPFEIADQMTKRNRG